MREQALGQTDLAKENQNRKGRGRVREQGTEKSEETHPILLAEENIVQGRVEGQDPRPHVLRDA
jgi:hypothetical protein